MGDTRLIHGRYRLLEPVGRGGMGEVWRATDESLGRPVAVKCLEPLGPRREQDLMRVLRERFRREARVAAALQHRGVTVVHDFGEWEGTLYLVMELLDGRDLSRLLEDNEHRPLPLPDVVDIAEQVADALAYTHRQGIVHRDLKPANVMRLRDGTVKICDFGIARLGGDVGFTARLTGTEMAMGTPHYMSPEQIGGGSVDHRSDLYSLGCVLYEIATGAPPFDLDDTWAVLVGHRDTPPEPLRAHRADLPSSFERIVLDLLAKDPADRPADADDLRRRLAGARPVAGPGTSAPAPWPSPWSAARLPPWAHRMTAGRKAAGAAPCALPPAPGDGLTAEWTARPGPPHLSTGARTAPSTTAPPFPAAGPVPVVSPPFSAAVPVPVAADPFGPARPVPPPVRLAALAGRHTAALRLSRLGRWEEAGEAHRVLAAEREHLLGPDHPDTLTSRYELGFALGRTGRAADALRVFGEVAGARARVLGPDHPDTLAARQETAYALGRLGRHSEARRTYEAVLSARTRTLGADHPDTLRCRHNLAFTLGRLGRLEESYRTAREVAAVRARVLGPDHPDTLVTLYEVGYVLGRSGRWSEALHTYREVAGARARVLGPDHPDTLAARYEEGISLGRLARWEEALAEAREVHALRERVLGADHPDTLVSHREVAVGLGRLGRWEEALAAHRRVAGARERVLGADHPDTLAGRNDEAYCLERLGRPAEAAEVYGRVAVLRGGGPHGTAGLHP